MLPRILCLGGLSALVAFAALTGDKRPAPATSAVLGSAMSLADVVSGTYSRPEEIRRKPKVQLAVRKIAKRACGENGAAACASRKPKMRDLEGGYRTLCVRLCDGFYYPISAAADPAEFAQDEETCRSSCASPAKLFVYRNRDGSPRSMTGLDGKPYQQLVTAFQHRVSYDPACSCTASPWTEASANRHRLYALNDAAAAGDRSRDAERGVLAAAVKEQESRARARSGADLVVASAARSKTAAEGKRRGAIRKAIAVRDREQRRAKPVRTAAQQPWVVRSLRSGAALAAAPRRTGISRQAGRIPVPETRVALRIQR